MRIFREIEAGAHIPTALGGSQPTYGNLAETKAIVAIASAKGGVGKSTITINLAVAMAQAGLKVAILDADLNSPSVLPMLGLHTPRRVIPSEVLEPAAGPLGLRIAASSLLAEGEPAPVSFLDEEAVPAPSANGHGPVELGYADGLSRLIGQTRLTGVDVLLIDLAPGLEQLYRISRMMPLTGAILITQPSEISVRAARNAIQLAASAGIRILGIVENMAGFNCEGCHAVRPLMPQGDLAAVAREGKAAVLARLPFDPRLAESCDRGVLFVREYAETPLAKQLKGLAVSIDEMLRAPAREAAIPPENP